MSTNCEVESKAESQANQTSQLQRSYVEKYGNEDFHSGIAMQTMRNMLKKKYDQEADDQGRADEPSSNNSKSQENEDHSKQMKKIECEETKDVTNSSFSSSVILTSSSSSNENSYESVSSFSLDSNDFSYGVKNSNEAPGFSHHDNNSISSAVNDTNSTSTKTLSSINDSFQSLQSSQTEKNETRIQQESKKRRALDLNDSMESKFCQDSTTKQIKAGNPKAVHKERSSCKIDVGSVNHSPIESIDLNDSNSSQFRFANSSVSKYPSLDTCSYKSEDEHYDDHLEKNQDFYLKEIDNTSPQFDNGCKDSIQNNKKLDKHILKQKYSKATKTTRSIKSGESKPNSDRMPLNLKQNKKRNSTGLKILKPSMEPFMRQDNFKSLKSRKTFKNYLKKNEQKKIDVPRYIHIERDNDEVVSTCSSISMKLACESNKPNIKYYPIRKTSQKSQNKENIAVKAKTLNHDAAFPNSTPNSSTEVIISDRHRGQIRRKVSRIMKQDSNVQNIKEESIPKSNQTLKETDEWKKVVPGDGGRVYFYNRRTRESRWTLPADAILVASKNSRRLKGNSSNQKNLTKTRSNDVGQGQDKELDHYNIKENTLSINNLKRENLEQSIKSEDKSQSIFKIKPSPLQISHEMDPNHQERHTELCKWSNRQMNHSCNASTFQLHTNETQTQQKYSKPPYKHFLQDSPSHGQMCDDMISSNISRKGQVYFSDKESEFNKKKEHFEIDKLQIFCPYCGIRCCSLSYLASHLSGKCIFIRKWNESKENEHIILQKIFMNAWEKSWNGIQKLNQNSFFNQQSVQTTITHEDNKSKYNAHYLKKLPEPPKASSSKGLKQGNYDEKECGRNVTSFSTPHLTAQTIACSKKFVSNAYGPSDSTMNSQTPAELLAITSACPFCGKTYTKGEKFSAHLLKCPERKRRRSRRVSTGGACFGLDRYNKSRLTQIDVPSTKMQSLVLNGGRELPGYPKH